MSKSVEGIYREGRIELIDIPADVPDGTRVTVTFPETEYDLLQHGIDQTQAADLRARLRTFTDEWESPEMDIYDKYDSVR